MVRAFVLFCFTDYQYIHSLMNRFLYYTMNEVMLASCSCLETFSSVIVIPVYCTLPPSSVTSTIN